KVKAQIDMDDTILENPELEKLLEERQVLKASVSEFRKADKAAKEKIQTIQTPMPSRVGRFLITKQPLAAKLVTFETEEGTRVDIKAVDED
ncbi:unnamed protein product, partial [marine sediment metagenome]